MNPCKEYSEEEKLLLCTPCLDILIPTVASHNMVNEMQLLASDMWFWSFYIFQKDFLGQIAFNLYSKNNTAIYSQTVINSNII